MAVSAKRVAKPGHGVSIRSCIADAVAVTGLIRTARRRNTKSAVASARASLGITAPTAKVQAVQQKVGTASIGKEKDSESTYVPSE